MKKPDSILALARRLLKIHGKPYDNQTSDADNAELERLALELAKAIVQRAERQPASASGAAKLLKAGEQSKR